MCAALASFLPRGGKRGTSENGGLRIGREGGPCGQSKVVEEVCVRAVSIRCRAMDENARSEVVGRFADI